MATKPKAILSTHDGREASPITKASNVLFEDGQTAQDILNDRQDAMISPVIENSSSMFKVGQGDNVDYSANVVNGAYESMVLKGNTKVNLIQEPSSKDVVLPYEFEDGQYVTINDTKESGALGVELKGQTLVNLVQGLKNEVSSSASMVLLRNISVKANTQYVVMAKVKSSNAVSLAGVSSFLRIDSDTTGRILGGVTGNIETTYTPKVFVFNTSDTTLITINLRNAFGDWGLAENTAFAKEIMLIEYQDGMENWDIPYFEGMASCKMPILSTTGKNLLPPVRNTWYPCRFKQGTTFKLSTKDSVPSNGGNVVFKDINGTSVWFGIDSGNTTSTKVLPCDVYYIMNSLATGVEHQLEIGTQVTSYEPNKTSILSLPEEVVLRSLPNRVRDTFNTRTGVYTKRIGEVTLNGGEDWILGTSANWYADGNTFGFYFNNFTLAQGTSLHIDKFLSTPNISTNDMEGCYISTQWSWVGVRICKTKLPSLTVDAFKQWLSQNPITIQYELAEPIITKINLPSTLKSWNTTTHIYSEIPENTLHPILSHSNPTYPVILKPSTKYSIVVNSYSNSHTNSAINFNLGGATASTTVGNRVTTITTPSTLSNELLIMSGRGNKLNNVMVIEKDVVGDEPYFEGICDCKSPILSNVGKNLLDENTIYSQLNTNKNLYIRYYNSFKCKPNTTYYFYADKGETKCNWHSVTQDITGVQLSNGGLTKEYLGYSHMVTTPSDCNRLAIYTGGNASIDVSSIKTAIYEVPNSSYEPYKSNILSCNGDKIELTQDMFEQEGIGGYSSCMGKTYEEMKLLAPSEVGGKRLRIIDLIRVKPNTTYRLHSNDKFSYLVGGFDVNKINNGKVDVGYLKSFIFTTSSDTYYIAIIVKKDDGGTISITDFQDSELMVSEVDKTIVLRSLPNGVCDTLNVETGEYVQRIGETILNGSQGVSSWWNTTSTIGVAIPIPTMKNISKLNCDKLPVVSYGAINNNTYDKDGIASWDAGNIIRFRIEKSKLTTEDVDGVKQYLQQNPITVQYELINPVVKTVDLSGYPFSYENGHVVLSSGSIEQSLTPKVEYSVATNRNGQIRSNQKIVERHQKQLDQLQAIILANLVNSQYNQTLTTLKYELSRV